MEEIEDIIASSDDEESDLVDDDVHAFSWAIEDGTTAVKKTDRSVFLYRETVIPQKIREFFSINDLQPGQKRGITLWHGKDRFDAFIEKTIHTSPRTRLMWKPEFAALLRTHYPQWLEFFQKNRKESHETPSIYFVKRKEPNHYSVELEGAVPHEITTEFLVPLNAGDVIDNDTLRAIFQCSSQGGMRRSLRTNSLVLISDHTKSAYVDKWMNNFFHYTGMGLTGEQSLSFQQNKTLVESKTNGVNLYLFEVFEEGKYVYIGEVELADRPYRSRQPDIEKNLRDVYIFPLQLKGHKRPPLLKKEVLESKEEIVRKKVHKLPVEELAALAKNVQPDSGTRTVTTEVRERNPVVSEYAKLLAKGICQLCDQPAPFNNRDGDPFLETHHIIPLAQDGPDTIENVAALCPNCHRKMHVLNLPADVAKLKNKTSLKV
ncbi:MAG: HNH endonuclease [Methanoregula sp.]|jgi:5-methylcytosine-specific restriction protein A|uniref:HNH endonuclease n=1 Tax=Methanoregula sp. TaxID=2052170 RepID=UPI0025DF3AAB|nr:HNH endonuclease signature motif containing protein [Methanoregula sp.]MCK9631044.1 HNH endonuclease [Methanoregula sp.]